MEKPTLSKLLKMQLLYCFSGLAYNVVSYMVVLNGGQQLSTTDPVKGALAMSVYGLFLHAATFGYMKTYRLLMLASIVIFSWGGVIIHVFNYIEDPTLYYSLPLWLLAMGINVFGLVLNVIAATGLFKNDLPVSGQ